MNFNHPNNMIYQAHSEQRNWMLKRGKAHQVYYNNAQIQKLRQYFEQMAGEEDHITVEQVREVLYSFGIVLSNEEVDQLVGDEVSFQFEGFLSLLKHSFVKNPRGIQGNYLTNKTLFYGEPLTSERRKAKSRDFLPRKLPSIFEDAI